MRAVEGYVQPVPAYTQPLYPRLAFGAEFPAPVWETTKGIYPYRAGAGGDYGGSGHGVPSCRFIMGWTADPWPDAGSLFLKQYSASAILAWGGQGGVAIDGDTYVTPLGFTAENMKGRRIN